MQARIWVALILAAVVASGIVALDGLVQARYQAEQHSDALQRLSALRARLESGLNSRLYLTDGLINLVALHPDIGDRPMPADAVTAVLHSAVHTVRQS